MRGVGIRARRENLEASECERFAGLEGPRRRRSRDTNASGDASRKAGLARVGGAVGDRGRQWQRVRRASPPRRGSGIFFPKNALFCGKMQKYNRFLTLFTTGGPYGTSPRTDPAAAQLFFLFPFHSDTESVRLKTLQGHHSVQELSVSPYRGLHTNLLARDLIAAQSGTHHTDPDPR